MILAYLAVVTYVIASTGIVTKDCQCTSSFHVYCLSCGHRDSSPYLVILPYVLFHLNILSSCLRNRYARYVQKLCKHGMYKNYEEYCYLVLEEEVCFILLGLL
jgi:hypothetical protein